MIIVAHFTQAWHCSVVSFCISFLRFASCVSRTCAYCYSMTHCITCLRNKCYGTPSAIRDNSLAQRDNQWMVGPARVYRMWLSDNGITVGHRPGVAVSQAFSYVIYRKRQFELLKHTRCFTEFFFLSRWSQHVRWIRALSNCVTNSATATELILWSCMLLSTCRVCDRRLSTWPTWPRSSQRWIRPWQT